MQYKRLIIRQRMGAGILLALFAFYAGSIVAFYHANLINGQLVAHSHPDFHRNQYQDAHPPAELAFLHQLSHIVITGEIVPQIHMGALVALDTFTHQTEESLEYSTTSDTCFRRGPPLVA